MTNASSEPITADDSGILWASLAPRPSLRAEVHEGAQGQRGPAAQNMSGQQIEREARYRHGGKQRPARQQRQNDGQRAEAADAAVVHDLQHARFGPAPAKGVGGIGEPIFVKAAGDGDQISQHRQGNHALRQVRAQSRVRWRCLRARPPRRSGERTLRRPAPCRAQSGRRARESAS